MRDGPDSGFFALQEALLGRYSLDREIGRGGMGIVYLAHEVALDRPVALKLLPLEMAAQPSLRERFLREARTAAKLSHPNVVPIYAVDEIDEFVFFVMAFIDGGTLGERIRGRGPLSSKEAVSVLRDVAWALAYSHAEDVVHRDVKPDNILLEKGSAGNLERYMRSPAVTVDELVAAESDPLPPALREGAEPEDLPEGWIIVHRVMERLDLRDLGLLIGEEGAELVLTSGSGIWVDAYVSGRGQHWFRVRERFAEETRPLADVRDIVRMDWIAADEDRRLANRIADLRARYTVVDAARP